MPRYFFHVRDGSDIPDHDGTELLNVQEARVQAVQLAGALVAEQPKTFVNGAMWHVEVVDERGLILFRIDFVATDAPAIKSANGSSISPLVS